MAQPNRPLARRVSLGVLVLVAGAGSWLLAAGLLDQWLRYRDYLAQGLALTDRACALPFCDFPIFWEAGRLAMHGGAADLYDGARFTAISSLVFAPHVNTLPFLYPPVALLPMAVLSAPALAASYYAWALAMLVAGVALARRAGVAWPCIAAGCLSLPGMWNLYLGQFGLVCGGLLVFGLLRLPDRPVAAGLAFGLLCIKPQYAILLPVVLLAHGNWRAMLAACGAVAALVLLSLFCFGWPAWQEFLGPGRAAAAAFVQAPFGPGHEMQGVSVFWMARSLGATLRLAYAAQCFVALLAGCAAWRLWRSAAAAPLCLAGSLCLVLLASPYFYTDDMVAYEMALPLLARRDAPLANAALALLWLAPAMSGDFAKAFGFLPMPVCVAASLFIVWWRLRMDHGRSTVPSFWRKRNLSPASHVGGRVPLARE